MKNTTALTRLYSRLTNTSDPNACWEWTGPLNDGYGVIHYNGKQWMTHRLAVLLDGRDPTGYSVCHSCDNPSCCNPSHLWLGDHASNMLDQRLKGRHAHGSNNGRALINEQIATDMRTMFAAGATRKEIASHYNVGIHIVKNVISGKTWKLT